MGRRLIVSSFSFLGFCVRGMSALSMGYECLSMYPKHDVVSTNCVAYKAYLYGHENIAGRSRPELRGVYVIRNDGVGGSNPSCGTIFKNLFAQTRVKCLPPRARNILQHVANTLLHIIMGERPHV